MYVDVSCDKNAVHLVAYLDGKYVVGCQQADTDKGYIIRYKRNEEGRFYIEGSGEIARERLEGKVELFINNDVSGSMIKFLKGKYNLPIEGKRKEEI